MTTYLFIDGAYFTEAYESSMRRFFGTVPTLNYSEFSRFGGPTKYYYYDSVDRSQIGQESPAERDERIRGRDELHAYLNSLRNWHVREGFVSRGRRATRRSQKAVDVQLAVDALEHAVAHNMHRAVFILGDLDFEPLFFSLNRFGIETTVWYERGTASQELLEAADIRNQLDLIAFFGLADPAFQQTHPLPAIAIQTTMPDPSLDRINTGLWKGRQVGLFRTPARDSFVVWAAPGPDPLRQPSLQVYYADPNPARTILLFEMTYGEGIVWKSPAGVT